MVSERDKGINNYDLNNRYAIKVLFDYRGALTFLQNIIHIHVLPK